MEFDQERLLANPVIAAKVLDYEVVEGNIYVVRFSGKGPMSNDRNNTLSIAYFLAPEDGEVALDGKQLLIGGEPAELPQGNLQFALDSETFKGTLEAFKAGSAKIHRKNLKSYFVQGRRGGGYSNGPWIVLENNTEPEYLERVAQSRKIE